MSQELSIAPAPANGATRSIMRTMAERFGMETAAFERTLMDTVMPRNTSKEAVAAFLVVAHEYGLNPFLREIYAFEGQGGGVRPMVPIDGWARLVNDHAQCDGFELIDIFDDKGNLVSVESRFYRKDRAHPCVIREHLAECTRQVDTWKRWPRRMLRHKAFIQGARYAFGFSGIEDEDEIERIQEVQGSTVSVRPVETARIDLTKARAGVASDPPGGSPVGTAAARVVEARAEPAKPAATSAPAAAPSFSDEDLPAPAATKEPPIDAHWFGGIEIFPDSFIDGWQRAKVATTGTLAAHTYETIAAAVATDPAVKGTVDALLKRGAEIQEKDGRTPVQYQMLSEALRVARNGSAS